MASLLKTVAVALVMAVACSTMATARPSHGHMFNNLIILGDSLSDIGNILVAPLTNILEDDGFFSENPYTGKAFYRPKRLLGPVCYQTVMEGDFNNGAGWSEYFLQVASQQGATKQTSVMANMYFYKKECQAEIMKNIKNFGSVSINYAWASAVTDGICRNYDKDPWNGVDCTDTKVITKNWLKTEAVGVKDLRKQYIPPVTSQMIYLQQDIQKKRVRPTGKDMYVIWSGANDLLANFRNITGFNEQTLKALKEIFGEAATANVRNAKNLLNMEEAKTNTVYLINQFNPVTTPIVSTIPGGEQLGKLIGEEYDLTLRAEILKFNVRNPLKKIYYVNAWDMFDDMRTEHPEYFTKAYDSLGMPVACPKPTTEEERLQNCKGYQFQYDGEHPTSTTHQLFAVKMFDFVSKNPVKHHLF
eukprot:Nk52_evm13s2650 gene=Nk52_evmTU13s2650